MVRPHGRRMTCQNPKKLDDLGERGLGPVWQKLRRGGGGGGGGGRGRVWGGVRAVMGDGDHGVRGGGREEGRSRLGGGGGAGPCPGGDVETVQLDRAWHGRGSGGGGGRDEGTIPGGGGSMARLDAREYKENQVVTAAGISGSNMYGALELHAFTG